jgi:hypothetical protein
MSDINNFFKDFRKKNVQEDLESVYGLKVSENFAYAYSFGFFTSFRYGSDAFFETIVEARKYLDILPFTELEIDLLSSDIGEIAEIENGAQVFLDFPMVCEDHLVDETFDLDDSEILYEVEKSATYNGKPVKLNSPSRNPGPGKKYMVYVRNPETGNIKKITFGDVKGGLSAKINDPKARAAFSARHDCPNKKDKLTPGYWACRLPRFRTALNLAGENSNDYW